jgi:hypothetical protein
MSASAPTGSNGLRPESKRANGVEVTPAAADIPAIKGVTITRLYQPVNDLDVHLRRIFALLSSAPEGEAESEATE